MQIGRTSAPEHTRGLGDELYLHLVDLRRALDRVATDDPVRVLDYGSGGSPYRSLFPCSMYHRADYVGGGLDYVIDAHGLIPAAPSDFYDVVLSTQVLEHVLSPSAYLSEAIRTLKPGGRFIVTTHGVFADHPCPGDYWRWTADGLRVLLGQAGFDVVQQARITAGPRAVCFLVGELGVTCRLPRSHIARLAIRVARWSYRRSRRWVDRLLDSALRDYAVREVPCEARVDFSIGLLAVARRPSEGGK